MEPEITLLSVSAIALYVIKRRNAASLHLNEQTATQDGPGLIYLFYRIPLQLAFIIWIYLSSIRAKA